MRVMVKWAAAIALAAAAAAPGAAAKSGKTAAADDPQREICRSQAVVGSRLKRIQVCMTAQEWEELQLQEQLGLSRKQINGAPGCPQPPCGMERGGKDVPW